MFKDSPTDNQKIFNKTSSKFYYSNLFKKYPIKKQKQHRNISAINRDHNQTFYRKLKMTRNNSEKNYKLNNTSFKNINLLKEKKTTELVNKVSTYLENKMRKFSIIDRFKESRQENLKKLLNENKSEQDILYKTFSTKFIGSDEYKSLSEVYGNNHSKKNGSGLRREAVYDDIYYITTKNKLFSKYHINPNLTNKEKNILSAVKKTKNKNIRVSSSNNYYRNHFDSFKLLQENKNLYNQLMLKQEKEQIKQYLERELQNEQNQIAIKLMPIVHTVELSKYQKKTENINDIEGNKTSLNSITDLLKIPRYKLFKEYNSVYFKFISKFLSTPTCRQGSKMLSYYDAKTNSNKILLFGGINVIRLDDLWECNITQQKLEKKYIWKKVEIKSDKPAARSGHSMIFYKDNLVIYGGIIEEKGGVRLHEDLLCYDIKEKKFSVEMCMNKFGITWRSYHISEIIGQYMLIYGGGDEKGNIIAEPWALDLEKMRWDIAKFNTDILPKRKFHCSCQVFPPQKKFHDKFTLFKVYTEPGLFNSTKILVEGIYMFGGIDENMNYCNDVLIIKRGKPLQLFKAVTKGIPPIARCECSMDFFEKLDVVIIYGGRNEKSKQGPYFNDMFFLDVQTLTWVNVELNDNKNFFPRCSHCSCIVDNEIIIFGGINENFYLKSDLFIGNLDILESSKIVKVNKNYKNKLKNKKDKNGSMENLVSNNLNNMNLLPLTGGSNFDSGSENSMSKINKDTKILMNKKIQTSKNFFLDFPKQRNHLQKKFKEIDAIKFNASDSNKIQEIIKNSFIDFAL